MFRSFCDKMFSKCLSFLDSAGEFPIGIWLEWIEESSLEIDLLDLLLESSGDKFKFKESLLPSSYLYFKIIPSLVSPKLELINFYLFQYDFTLI